MNLGKKLIWAAVAAAFACGSANAQTKVVVDPGKKYQYFEGWGTSLCWWAVKTGAWSEANYTKLLGAVADPDTGLGYNIFRYNIGGGDQPGHNHLTKGDGGAAVPGYKPTEKGDYDWNADKTQRNIIFALNKMVKDPIFEAFSNSPPWWMTNSGCVAGGVNGADNLKSDYFDDFADYLSEVALHFKKEWGITFRTVEPFNEPSAGWWKENKDQEGCGFKSRQSDMIIELGKALKKKGLFPETSVTGADESSIADALKQFNGYSAEARSYMFQMNTHSYDGYSSRQGMYEAAFAADKRIWQSESGPLHRGNSTLDITLWMADVILHDLRDMKANAWVDWQLSDPAANWQTIKADHSKQTFSYSPRYYMHKTFTHAIRPGSQFIDSDNSNTLAAIREDGSLVIVVLNTTGNNVSYAFDLNKFSAIGSKAKVNRFTLPAALKADADIAISNKTLNVTAGAQSIVTLVVDGAKSEGQCDVEGIKTYVKIHDGGWNEITDIKVNVGDSLVIGPHPYSGARWTWNGPNDFYQLGREVRFKNMQESQSGTYTGTVATTAGCAINVDFKVTVIDPNKPVVEPIEPEEPEEPVIPQDTAKTDTSIVVDTTKVDTTTADTTVKDSIKQDTSVIDTTPVIKDSTIKDSSIQDTSTRIRLNHLQISRIAVSRHGGDLHISAPSETMVFTMHDLQGNLLMRQQISGNTEIPVSQFARRGFIVQIRNMKGNSLYLRAIR